jgi:hypothetical protein
MMDKFDIKDYFNYSIAGLLWVVIILKFLDVSSIYKFEELTKVLQIQNSGILITISLLFGTYILGNILRFTEKLIICITDLFYGDIYSCALRTDSDMYLKGSKKLKIAKLGLRYMLFNKKPLGIGFNSSLEIEKNLKDLKIYNKSKKNQHIMCETFLLLNYSDLKYNRLKNLKNLYESISFPFFIIMIWIANEVKKSNDFNCYCKSIIFLIIILVVIKFIDRYRYLKSNFIKDIYRYFLFIKKKN